MSLFLSTGKTGTGRHGETRAQALPFALARAPPTSLMLRHIYRISLYNAKIESCNISFDNADSECGCIDFDTLGCRIDN